MQSLKRGLLAVVLALMVVGLVTPAHAQEATGAVDTIVIVTNTPGADVEIVSTPAVEAPVSVPDVTIEVPQVVFNTSDPALPWIAFTMIVLGAMATVVLIGRPLILQLGASAPAWAVEGGISAGESALNSAERYAKSTPAPYDDVAVAEFRREFNELRDEVRRLRAENELRALAQG